MRIGVFAYNFPHYKTQQGLLNLRVNGVNPIAIFAQDKKTLTVPHSVIRVAPRYEFLHDPASIFNMSESYVFHMDHSATADRILDLDLDLGIILGARILPKEIIQAFNFGILNLHPGLIPENRGLDNLKWAIYDNIPQGVTAHFIDYPNIDSGSIVVWDTIKVYKDDSLVDIHIRLQETEQQLLLESLYLLNNGMGALPVKQEGKYNSAMTKEQEFRIQSGFLGYRLNYETMLGQYENCVGTEMWSCAR